MEDEIAILNRKLRETEARLTSKLLLSAQQSLPKEFADKLIAQFENNKSLDLLQMERDISDNAKLISDCLTKIYEAAKDFKVAKANYDSSERDTMSSDNLEDTKKMQKVYDAMVVSREKLFSLLAEYEIKYRYLNLTMMG